MSYRVEKNIEVIDQEIRDTISKRYKRVTKAINKEFWDIESETSHSLYVGSYGRGTAIDTSDIDILMELPKSEYERYDTYKGNGQSRLLQAVKEAILSTYPKSDIKADGQIIKINFSDDIDFEILPAFKNTDYWGNWDGTYSYPDTNMGGNWRSTNPKAEIDELQNKNKSSNGLLKDTCKHMRRIKQDYFGSYSLSGIVIDSFVYHAIGDWKWLENGEGGGAEVGSYEKTLLQYFNNIRYNNLITAPGSSDQLDFTKSSSCLEKILNKINS